MYHIEQFIVESKRRERTRQIKRIGKIQFWILLLVLCLLVSGCSTGDVQGVLAPSSDIFQPVGRYEKAAFGDGYIVGHIGGPATSIQVTDKYAYLGHSSEIAVIDLSDPASPARVGYLLLSALDMILDVDTVYVAGRGDHWTIDVARLIAPATQKRWFSPYYVHDVFVTQDTIYRSSSQGRHNLRTVSASPHEPQTVLY